MHYCKNKKYLQLLKSKYYFSFILINPNIVKIVNKKKGKNTDKYKGILPLTPSELKIKFI